MSDGTEVSFGLNPLLKDTDGNGVEDGQEIVTQEVRLDSVKKYSLQDVGTLPTMTMTGKGDYSQEIYAIALENDARFAEINSLVGTPFDIVHDDDLTFEKSCVTFKISDDILAKTPIEQLSIASYNEETNAIEFLETTYDAVNQTISAEPTHYSPIFVCDVLQHLREIDWENEDSIIESGKADVVFVIDTTGSMWGEIQNVRNNIDSFVSRLEENKVDIRLGLVEYRDIYADGIGSTKSYDWYTSVDSFKSELASLGVDGGGDTPESVVDALYCARNMKYRSGVRKYIILLTDANYKNGTSVDAGATLDDEIRELCADEIVVSVVTTPSYASVYNQLVSKTEGVCANINQNFTAALEPLIEKMGETVNSGYWVRLSNGTIVELKADPTLGDDTVDTDGDGMPDLLELIECVDVAREDPISGNIVRYKGWTFESNPVKSDTDGDGLGDFVDYRKCIYDAILVEITDEYVKFNSGRTWNIIPCDANEYVDNVYFSETGNGANSSAPEDLPRITRMVIDNEEQDFSVEELAWIGVNNNEGSKLYLHEKTSAMREEVFRLMADRESRYFRHSGLLYQEGWRVINEGGDIESGFWGGIVLSEADLNLSWKRYAVADAYTVMSGLAVAGALVIVVCLVREATPVVLTNLQWLNYNVKSFGVVQGFKMYSYLGFQKLPDGIVTWLQMDMADGDTSLDDMGAAIAGGKYTPTLKMGDPNSLQYRQVYNVNNIRIQVNSGHAYNRVHSGGKVSDIATMKEAENAIIKDISVKLQGGVIANGDYTVVINGKELVYRIHWVQEINGYGVNYFPQKK